MRGQINCEADDVIEVTNDIATQLVNSGQAAHLIGDAIADPEPADTSPAEPQADEEAKPKTTKRTNASRPTSGRARANTKKKK